MHPGGWIVDRCIQLMVEVEQNVGNIELIEIIEVIVLLLVLVLIVILLVGYLAFQLQLKGVDGVNEIFQLQFRFDAGLLEGVGVQTLIGEHFHDIIHALFDILVVLAWCTGRMGRVGVFPAYFQQ